jgi:hypothetical protein
VSRTAHIGSFPAYDDAGNREDIQVYQQYIDVGVYPPEEIEGLKQLRTTDGRHVNWISKGEYEVVEFRTMRRLHSTAPDAI